MYRGATIGLMADFSSENDGNHEAVVCPIPSDKRKMVSSKITMSSKPTLQKLRQN